MPKIPVQSVDLLVHPFYKLAKKADNFTLTPKEREFAIFLQRSWKSAVVRAKRRAGCLFIIIGSPLVNPELIKLFEELAAFAKRNLGKRFRQCSIALSQNLRSSGGRLEVSLAAPPFSNVKFSSAAPILIQTFGESLGICPVTEARLLQAALSNAGFRAKPVQRTERSVRESHSMARNTRRMCAGSKPVCSLSQRGHKLKPY